MAMDMSKDYAAARVEALRLIQEEGATTVIAARAVGVTHQSVSTWAKSAGIELVRGTHGGLASHQDQIRKRAVLLRQEGWSLQRIGDELGFHRATIAIWLKAYGIPTTNELRAQARDDMMRVRAQALVMLDKGVLAEDVSQVCGVSLDKVQTWRNRLAMTPDSSPSPDRHVVPIDQPGPVVGRGKRLCLAERVAIAGWLSQDPSMSAARIARQLGRCRQTVSREIRRGCIDGVYYASTAQHRAQAKLRRQRPSKIDSNPTLRTQIITYLNLRWSPEQIAGELKILHGSNKSMTVSHETIYQALYVQGKGALRQELKVEKALRTGRSKRQPRSLLPPRAKRPWVEGAHISTRPAEAEDRAVPGHWEGDLVIGKAGATALITLVERHSRFTLIHRLADDHTAGTVTDALTKMVSQLPRDLLRSLTWDQGSEMAQCASFEIASGCKVFYCDPHSPWQRGSNENTNGLIRDFFPKGTNFADVTDAEVHEVQDLLNGRPRKTLGFAKPSSVLNDIINGAITA